jgi:hypothetical protein
MSRGNQAILAFGGAAAAAVLFLTTTASAQAADTTGSSASRTVQPAGSSSPGAGPLPATLGASADSSLVPDGTLATKRYPIAPGYEVNVRSGPGTNYGVVRTLPEGTSVPINCQTPGESVTGPYGTSDIWDNIANSQFVSDAYVQTGSDGYITARCH